MYLPRKCLRVTLALVASCLFSSMACAETSSIDAYAHLPKGRQVSEQGIRHSFLITGGKMTAIFNEASEVVWWVKGGSRDGTVLPSGNILICESRRVVEYAKDTTDVVWSYQLNREQNKEIAAAWRLQDGNTLIVENGGSPRLREVTREGAVVVDFPLQPETENAHMQSRMARKLPNGNYLVPHLLAFSVKEYTPTGEVVREIQTDLEELGGRSAKNWPFTAILGEDGRILVNLTNGNKTVIFDQSGAVLWKCDNQDVDGRYADPCGAHFLPNQNVVIGSYGQKDRTKPIVFEVNSEKEVVWEFYHPIAKAHEIHVLTTNGVALQGYSK